MSTKLSDDQLKTIGGAGEFTLYDFTFNDGTKVKDLLNKFPWLVNLNSNLQLAANLGFTVGSVKQLTGMTDQDILDLIEKGQEMYNPDGTIRA